MRRLNLANSRSWLVRSRKTRDEPAVGEGARNGQPILYMVNAFCCGFLGVSGDNVGVAYAIMLGAVAIMFARAVVLMYRGTGIRD